LSSIQRRPAWLPAAGAAASGVLAALAFPGVEAWPLAWVALVPLLAALTRRRPWHGGALGFLHGLAFFSCLVPWIPGVVHRHGYLSWGVAMAVGALLVVILALFHALFGAWWCWLHGRLGDAAFLLAAPAWVVLAEWCRLWPAGGFSWGLLGYTTYRSAPILVWAPWGGVHGLSLLILSVNAGLAAAFAARGRIPRLLGGALAVVIGLAAWGIGAARAGRLADEGEPFRVAAVQGNVLQDEKWQVANRGRILERHLALSDRAASEGARLVVWPESSTVEQVDQSAVLASRLREIAARHDTHLLVGSLHRTPRGSYTNSAFLLDGREGIIDRYDKHRLVPFGETVPLRRVLFFVEPLVEAVGNFEAGTDLRPLGRGLDLAGGSTPTPFGVAICYEITYPALVAALVGEGATFLVTITNDAWFGRSAAAAQHFAMAVVRAAETRRWLVRAANTGISGIVDPSGSIRESTPLFEERVIAGTVRARHDLTLAVRHPHAVPSLCVILLALASLVPLRPAERPRS
jgi:apolipoprotein N-acyltransferase